MLYILSVPQKISKFAKLAITLIHAAIIVMSEDIKSVLKEIRFKREKR